MCACKTFDAIKNISVMNSHHHDCMFYVMMCEVMHEKGLPHKLFNVFYHKILIILLLFGDPSAFPFP